MLRYLLCVCVVLAGCANTTQVSNRPILVNCEGRTFEQAKQNCFSTAIEIAVGAVVVTETEVRTKRLVKDEILKHNSGYVENYVVQHRDDEPGRVFLVMDVVVRQSKIAERIMSAQTATGQFKGEQLGAQYSTFIQTKDTGDKLLRKVVDDYPKNAFNIEKGSIKYHVNLERDPVIIVPFKVSWNYKYIQALNEALAITQNKKDDSIKQDRIIVRAKSPDAWVLGRSDTYYFNDTYRTRLITESLVRPIFIKVSFLDAYGNVLISGCDEGRHILGPNVTDPFIINGNTVIEEDMNITIRANKQKIQKVNEVVVSITGSQCTFID